MTRMKSGAVALIAAGLGFACSNPTSDLQTGPKRVLATPQFAVIDSGGSTTVLVQAFDEQGYAVPGTITFTADPTLGVAIDPNFRKSATLKYGQQYIITGLAADTGQVIFSVGGLADTFSVFTKPPATLAGATIDVANPTLGQLVTVTVPPGGYVFTAASASDTAISVAGGAKIASPVVSPDGSQISFTVGPDANGPATIQFVQPTFANPPLPTISIVTPPITTAAKGNVTASDLAPALGDPVTVTVPVGGYAFTSASTPTVTGAATVVVGLSADSTQLTFLAGPNGAGLVTVDNIIVEVSPALGFYTMETADTFKTPALTNIAANYSTATPAVNGLVTVTAPGFKFYPSVSITFGSVIQTITSVAADSSSFTFRASQAGTSGTVTISNAALGFLTSVPLSLPTAAVDEITVGPAVTEIAGTDAIATAPIVTLPGAGQSAVITDAPSGFGLDQTGTFGAGGTRAYKVTVTTETTIDISATWNNTVDIGIYLEDATGALLSTTTFPPADAAGTGVGGQPEETTWTLPPGTYIFGVAWFQYGPVLVPPTALTIEIGGN